MHQLQPLPRHRRHIANWLLICLALVALMVAVGGVTRLTESGLSIVEWKLISGILPPMNDAAWNAEFEQYQKSPQFRQVNAGFSIADFKGIFWLEYLHRLLGRVIGLAVIAPLAYFAARQRLPRPLLRRGIAIAALVGAQGAVGWVMVASGLQDTPRVEPLKLATHLLLAFGVFALLLWTRWQVLNQPRHAVSRNIALTVRALLALVIIQILFGALVAGLRAGLAYNSYPLMDGALIPDGLHRMNPWWLNHMESSLTVQFQHRMGALAVLAATAWLVLHGWCDTYLRPALIYLTLITMAQFALGVATLLSMVHIWLASAHQLLALALVAILVRLVYLTERVSTHHSQHNTMAAKA